LEKKTKISKKYARMMEFHKEFDAVAKEGGGAWTMYPLYTPLHQEDFAKDRFPQNPLKDPFEDPHGYSPPPFQRAP
jgi:hypothetical protein